MIKISAAEFAKVVSGKLHLLSEETILNEIPVINSKRHSRGHSLLPLRVSMLMAMILLIQQLHLDQSLR